MRVVLILLFFKILFAEVVNNKNLDVLRVLDIDSSLLTYKPLEYTYKVYYKNKSNYFLNIIENGFTIIPIIRKKIISSKIPQELISVALAESYLSLNAKSRKKAIGLWQFMPQTARRFGLRIDDYVDERKDPIKSTEAAIDYLTYLKKLFGKWYLAILAYNAGEARIIEAVDRVKVDKLCKKLGENCKKNKKIRIYRKIIRNYQLKKKNSFKNLYALYKKLNYISISLKDLLINQEKIKRQYLPRETRDYILKILSLSFLLNSDDFIKFTNSYILNSGISSELVKVEVPSGTSLFYVAKLLNISYKKLKQYNPHLKHPFTPPYKYYIYIPYSKLAYFKNHFVPKKRYFYVYKVKKGDTLFKIAKKFNIKVKVIKDYNKLGKFLSINQKLILPLNYAYVNYKVKKGDSLRLIAKKFGISYQQIKKANNLKSDIIRVGDILKIPQRL